MTAMDAQSADYEKWHKQGLHPPNQHYKEGAVQLLGKNQPQFIAIGSEIPTDNSGVAELIFCFLCTNQFELGAAPVNWRERSFCEHTAWQVFCANCVRTMYAAIVSVGE